MDLEEEETQEVKGVQGEHHKASTRQKVMSAGSDRHKEEKSTGEEDTDKAKGRDILLIYKGKPHEAGSKVYGSSYPKNPIYLC